MSTINPDFPLSFIVDEGGRGISRKVFNRTPDIFLIITDLIK